ncbi:ABC transporter substrate-binding protein [Thermodesulfobacteriota bacterium]
MRKKTILLISSLLLITVAGLISLPGCSEKKQKVYHVGILTDFSPFMIIADSFKAGMAELGYIEGENIVYDLQIKDFDPEGQKAAIKQFIEDKVDLIFTFPTEASVIAYQLTQGTGIPVVFAMCGYEGNIPVESVSNPGGNITGVRFPGPDNVVKHLELMLEIKPETKRVWATYNPNYPNTKVMVEDLRKAALSINVELLKAPNETIDGVKADLKALEASGEINIDAILLLPEGLSQNPDVSKAIVEFASKHNLPVGGGVPSNLDQGIVFAFLPDESEVGKAAAPLAQKIFNGIPAGTIPLVTPENYLYLNYKVISELGLTVDEGLLTQAKEIIR